MSELPRYDDLPIDPGKPPRATWGVFGEDDQVGTLNLIGDSEVRAAAGCVRSGRVFALNWDVELPRPAILGRHDVRHTLLEDAVGRDEFYDSFYPQSSSQWDGLTHVRHPEWGFYNGHEAPDAAAGVLGIQHWARRGIVGRFVLADVARHRGDKGRPLDCSKRTPVSAAELEAVLGDQGVELRGGDILLLRFGWTAWYESLGDEERRALATAGISFGGPGISADESSARWLWDHGVAAIGADCPALEATPFDQTHVDGFLHYRLIPLLGMAIAELLALDGLAEDCSADGVYDGLFTAAPINKTGGAGSPANALAIK